MDYTTYRGRGRHKSTGAPRPPTYLPNESEWAEQILCIEGADQTYGADSVLGGADGITNAPIQALANRTLSLKDQQGRIRSVINAILQALAPQLTAIKSVLVQTTKPTDMTKSAWLNFGRTIASPSVKLILEDGRVLNKPTFRILLDNGMTFYLRTDGQVMQLEPLEE